tara:strand:+ start:885 stop:1985 length:1101 start_codon:yes stop_codon:yes gene_type:complete
MFLVAAKAVRTFGGENVYKIINTWAKSVFIVDSIFIYTEVFARFSGLGYLQVFLQKNFIEIVDPGRFESVTNSIDQSIFDAIPIALGPRGFPHYSAPLFLTAAIILITSSFNKKERNLTNLYVTNTISILIVLGVKTHILIFILMTAILFLRNISLKISLNFVMYGIFLSLTLFLLYFYNDSINDLFNKWIDQLVNSQFTYTPDDDNPYSVESSRFDLILNIKWLFIILSRVNLFEFIFGTNDYFLEKISDVSHEQAILIFAYKFGFLAAISFISTAIYGTLNFMFCNKYIKYSNNREYLIHSSLIFLPFLGDILHFGQFLAQPDIAIAGFLLGYASTLTPKLINYESQKKQYFNYFDDLEEKIFD